MHEPENEKGEPRGAAWDEEPGPVIVQGQAGKTSGSPDHRRLADEARKRGNHGLADIYDHRAKEATQ